MKWTWPAWKLIESRRATYTEVTEKMSIIDIIKLHEAVAAVAEAEYKYRKQQEKNNK